jgi:hypothetical protein
MNKAWDFCFPLSDHNGTVSSTHSCVIDTQLLEKNNSPPKFNEVTKIANEIMCILWVLQCYWRVSYNRRYLAILATVQLQATSTVLHYRQRRNARWITILQFLLTSNNNFMKALLLHRNIKMTRTHTHRAHARTHVRTHARILPAVFHICKKPKFGKLFPLLSSHEYTILILLSPPDGTAPGTQIDSIKRRITARSIFLHQDGITSRFWCAMIFYLNWQDGRCVCLRIFTVLVVLFKTDI